MKRWSWIFVAASVAALAWASQAGACPTCSDALGDQPTQDLGRGFFWSILLMLGLPFTMLSSIGIWLFLLWRRGPEAPLVLAAGERTPDHAL